MIGPQVKKKSVQENGDSSSSDEDDEESEDEESEDEESEDLVEEDDDEDITSSITSSIEITATTGWAKSQVPFFYHKKLAHVLSNFLVSVGIWA